MVLALVSLALAQPVSRVPPGASAVTVLLCPRADGCDPEWRAMATHAAALSLPLLDFDALALAGPGGRDRLLAFEAAMAPIRRGGATRGEVDVAIRALSDLPFTVTNDDLFRLWLAAGATGAAEGALVRAATVGGGRVTDLGPLPDEVLRAYLDAAAAPRTPARLFIDADGPGRVFVDGRAVGETPLRIDVLAGWHRVSVERSGRQTAWVGAVELPAGEDLRVHAQIGADDGAAALEAAVIAARRGMPAPDALVAGLRAWGRDNGLRWVRFVELQAAGGEAVPEERVPDPDPSKPPWEVHAVYLDVATGRLGPRGPGPAAMVVAGDPDRFRLGVSVGYLHLRERVDTDLVPAHDHATVELAAQLRLLPTVSLDVRLGVAHAAQPYYLDEDWLDENVYPVSAGARLGEARGGPYVTAGALVVVPYAVGGQLRAGWDLAPATPWRVAPELTAGVTDKGWLLGGTLVLTRLR